MKSIKKVFSVLLALVVLFTVITPAIETQAAATNVSAGSWVNVTKDETSYKITVKKEGYITVSGKFTKNGTYGSGSTSIDVFDAKKNKIVTGSFGSSTDNNSFSVALSAGTYYLNIRNLYLRNHSLKIKYDFTAVKQDNNYSFFNAVKLTANKAVRVCQTQSVHYDRWFKITTKKAQKLTITVSPAITVQVYDSDYMKIDTSSEYKSNDSFRGYIYTTSKLTKGTYYIKVSDPNYYIYDTNIFDIKVK